MAGDTGVFRQLPLLWVRLGMALAMGLALFSPLASASAQTDSASNPASIATRNGRFLGIHPAIGAVSPSAPTLGSGKVTYHGGPVEHTNTVYAIYWLPSGYSVSTKYVSLINRFFGDVAADDGKTTNVYYDETQYSDTTGNVQYKSTFAGSAT